LLNLAPNRPRGLASALLVTLAGCLPAYDNGLPPGNDGGTADMATDGSSDDAGPPPNSGLVVSGHVFGWEANNFLDGLDGYVQSYPLNKSMAAMKGGTISVPIPQPALNQSDYLVFEGTPPMGLPALRTHIGPKLKLDGSSANKGLIFHVLMDDQTMTGVRTAIGAELAAHGDVPMADGADGATFGAKWNWLYGHMFYFDISGSPHDFSGETITVTGDGGMCKVFYTESYVKFKGGTVPSLINFSATSTPGGFVVLCPPSQTQDITLTPGGTIRDNSGLCTTIKFDPIDMPMALGDAVYADWAPTTCI
jgi:hypothetical protein